MIKVETETSTLSQLVNMTQKLVIYTRLANYDNIKKRLMQILNSEDKKRVFEATDGKNSTREIEAITGEESPEVRGRRRRVLSLIDFGIEASLGKKQHELGQKTKRP